MAFLQGFGTMETGMQKLDMAHVFCIRDTWEIPIFHFQMLSEVVV